MMERFRNNPPVEIIGSKVERILDYQALKEKNLLTGEKKALNFPTSDVLQFYLADGSKVSVRPSGTEPKIKFYMSVRSTLKSRDQFSDVTIQLDKKIKGLEEYLLSV